MTSEFHPRENSAAPSSPRGAATARDPPRYARPGVVPPASWVPAVRVLGGGASVAPVVASACCVRGVVLGGRGSCSVAASVAAADPEQDVVPGRHGCPPGAILLTRDVDQRDGPAAGRDPRLGRRIGVLLGVPGLPRPPSLGVPALGAVRAAPFTGAALGRRPRGPLPAAPLAAAPLPAAALGGGRP